MKVCPFCREEIHDEAIKCRYCGSSLLPLQPAQPSTENSAKTPAAGPDQVVYILDQGLIRFAKFAAAILAIFVTVGLILYGVDVKQTAKEVQESRDAVAKDRADAEKTLSQAQAQAKDQVNKLQQQVQIVQEAQTNTTKMVTEAQAARDSVNASQQQAQASLAQAKQILTTIANEEVQARTFVARIGLIVPGSGKPDSPTGLTASVSHGGFSAVELAQLYNFPMEFNGSGQKIGLIALGGGYRNQDLDAYFKNLHISTPKVTAVSVDGGTNHPTEYPGGPDGEVEMDIEVAGAVAPGAEIVVYFAPNTDQGFVHAIQKAVTDQTNRLSILAITWGGPESTYSNQTVNAMNNLFQTASTRGITVLAASGDNGVTDGVQDGKAHADFPATSPWVLTCGGTHIDVVGNKITSEVVWNDSQSKGGATGGGVSSFFPKPAWQSTVDVPADSVGHVGRGVPDVAISASPQAGYSVVVDGESLVLGGTAASAPLWAGLIALVNQGLGHNVGYINPILYSKIGPSGTLHAITQGDNGSLGFKGYPAGPGWNAATGWGSPDGKKLLQAFRDLGSP